MPRRYIAIFEYTEAVHGEHRDFIHETIIEADGDEVAYESALHYFETLARQSGVGWKRALKRCAVAAAPRGAVAKGGRRVFRDRETET